MNSQPSSLVAILSQMEEDGRTYKLATIDEIRAAIVAMGRFFRYVHLIVKKGY